MNITKTGAPAYTIAYVQLEQNESLIAEPGSMVAMSSGIYVNPRMEGGIIKSFGRRLFGEEAFFFTKYTATTGGSWVALSPVMPGDIYVSKLLPGEKLMATSGSILAHAEEIVSSIKIAGIKTMLMQEGLTAIELSGEGDVLLSTYGSAQEIGIELGQELIIDTGHLLAWSPNLEVQVGPLAGIFGQAFSGEGLVAKFISNDTPGKVIIQTRAEQDFRDWIFPTRVQNTKQK